MSNGDECAFPATNDSVSGLTKRELFAAMAMQGALSSGTEVPVGKEQTRFEVVAQNSVAFADALLAELERTK